MENFINRKVIFWNKESVSYQSHDLIREEPLSIQIQGKPYTVIMRTPGDEFAHAAGFSLSEGIADEPDDIENISFCDGNTNAVTVTLKPSRENKISRHIERRNYISQTTHGICGKEIVKELCQRIHPISDNRKADINNILNCMDMLSQLQSLRHKTKASHAAAIYNSDYALLSFAEDVGRHNALDKAVGKLFLERKLHNAFILLLGSRISYELVQKAARARIPIILAVSRPTNPAVELASELNMTLASLARESGIYIFCGEHRLTDHF